MSEIRVRTVPENLIKVRLGADNANRVVASVANLNLKLGDLNDVNIASQITNTSVLVYNTSTNEWNAYPYPYFDGGTY